LRAANYFRDCGRQEEKMKLEQIYTSETPKFSLDRQIKCFVPQLSKNFPCIHICLQRKKSFSDSRKLLGKLVRSFKIVVGNMEMKEDMAN